LWIDVEFTWDPRKARLNFAKHGVSFETAKEALFDPNVVILEDSEVGGEIRYRAIGYPSSVEQLLVVVFVDSSTEEKESIRIISARKAERYEQSTYSDQFA
jgi:uncharacterized DUF497 family protein